MNKKLNILVVGSNGMVGSSVIRKLSKSEKVNSLIASTRMETDLFSYSETKKLIETTSPDVLINAAAKVGGILYNNTRRTEFILENLKINMNLLESCIDQPKIKIINLGSSCIYPLNAKNPIKESEFMNGQLEPTNSPYAMAKLSSIELGRALNIQYGHTVINLMPTNLYGPNDFFHPEKGHVIPSLFYRMHNAKVNNDPKFSIWGSGTPKREFLFVDELSTCIEFLIDKEPEEDLFNVGSGEEVTIKELALKIKNVINFKGELKFDSSKPDGNPRKLLDCNKINNFGWKSSLSLDDGLEITYKWFLENLENIRG